MIAIGTRIIVNKIEELRNNCVEPSDIQEMERIPGSLQTVTNRDRDGVYFHYTSFDERYLYNDEFTVVGENRKARRLRKHLNSKWVTKSK